MSERFSLQPTHELLAAFGWPESALKGIHIAGTNGKGSTAAMLFAALSATKLKVGLYTSPHLVSHAERFRISLPGQPGGFTQITHPDFQRLMSEIEQAEDKRAAAGGQPATWYERLTVLGMLWFREQAADWVILETGLGGRLDATNIKDWEHKIITPIGLDHQAYLGDTIEQIATEKAGILHPANDSQQRYLTTTATGEALSTIRQIAQQRGVKAQVVGEHITLQDISTSPNSTRVNLSLPNTRLEEAWHTPLPGIHQATNLAGVVGCLTQMATVGDIPFEPDKWQAGIARTHWPGRLEWVDETVWPSRCGRLLLDGAHNPQAMRLLVDYLRKVVNQQPESRLRILFGVKRDKPGRELLSQISQVTRDIVLAPISPGVPSWRGDQLTNGVSELIEFETPAEAMRALQTEADPNQLTVVCGSLYLVGEVRGWLYDTPRWPEDTFAHNSGLPL